jgi:selenocysteine lyase/cysteine desulfurase
LDHEFVGNIEELEEAGTPGILQDVRTGLAFDLKENVGETTIRDREHRQQKKTIDRLLNIKNLVLLGNNNLPKVNIFSFLIRSRFGKLLHPNFVTSLLNDLFGIQTRAGCSCASMFGQKLLGIDLLLSRRYKDALFDGNELMRVGYVRFNVPYFFNDADVDFLLDAIEFVAEFGWLFLPSYKFDYDTGIWKSREEKE